MESAELPIVGSLKDKKSALREIQRLGDPILHRRDEAIKYPKEALLLEQAALSHLEKEDSIFHTEDAQLSDTPLFNNLTDEGNDSYEFQISKESIQPPPVISSLHSSETLYFQSDMEEPQKPTATKIQPLFRQSKITIAVDVSGSTYGKVIETEVKAIRSICSLFPQAIRSTIKVLPWSNIAEYPISLDELDELDPNGDTDPTALLHDDACRYELQSSSFWFLMTDGDIFGDEVRNFARSLVEYGLHGLASVVAIFGERELTPSKCNVSVGLSVFAVSPHCAFLYTDVETGKTYILQTKGCFSALLPKGRNNPTLDNNTAWADLPQTSYENLARVSIPPPQSVSKHEVVLKDNSRLNLSDLLSNPIVDPQIANRIMDHEDNMKTIALTAKLKGQSKQFQRWLDGAMKINDETLHPDKIERPESDDSSDLLVEMMTSLMKTEKPGRSNDQAQKELRDLNSQNLQQLEHRVHAAQVFSARRSSSGRHFRRVSSSDLFRAEDNISSVNYKIPPLPQQQYLGSGRVKSLGQRLSLIAQTSEAANPIPMTTLFNPGFNKPDLQKDYYKGTCMLCGSGALVMALLLKKPSNDQTTTLNFPPPDSSSNLKYPLTMGNYPETDIITPIVACDPCSYRIARKGRMPSGEEISAALPLLSFIKNRTAWLETINRATQNRFSGCDLPQVFLAILYTKLERLLDEKGSGGDNSLKPALSWCCNTLLQEVELQYPPAHGNITFDEDILRIFQSTLNTVDFIDLLTYPMDGFIVANVALLNSRYKNKISVAKRQRIVFYRFLYHLTEQYIKLSAESEEMVVHATMMLLLILDDRGGPRSLLALDTLRQFSVHFKNRQEMMRTLKSHLNWQPRKHKPKKLSISVKDLLGTPFLDARSLRDFQRLGNLFTWIEDKAAHAIAAFLHYLYCMGKTAGGAPERFIAIRKIPEMGSAMSSPEEMSAKKIENLVKDFALL